MTAAAPSLPVLSLDAIEALVCESEPRALFVEPRILRRVIIQDRRIPGLGIRVPHSKVYTIERERLLIVADRSELGLSPAEELHRRMILLARPTDDEEFSRLTSTERLHAFWRLTFHGRVHAEVEQLIEDQQLTSALIAERIRQIGAGEFAEVRHVLFKDDLLLPPQDDEVAYVEFLAVALELKYFAPWDLRLFFPAIRNWEAMEPLWADLPHETWYRETQPAGAPERLMSPVVAAPAVSPPVVAIDPDPLAAPPSPNPSPTLLLAQADRAGQVGNQIKAAILRMRAANVDSSTAESHRAAAELELRQLAERLQRVWRLSDSERDEWWQALCPLLTRAADGYRSLEARVLYDLQKVCIANERGVYRFNVWGWVKTFGNEPLRRELPLLETVQSAKYLQSTAERVSSIRISAVDRNRLMALIDVVQTRSDQELRQTVRPLIEKTFDDVGLVPQNIPERVARRKVIEGLLDRLVERGFITMGDVRDALSQNSLKLPDVSGPLELAWGDRLLRADRQLGKVLDGVYRQGAVYLRASQRLSSLAFGTPLGRFLVRNVALPFGGAYLALAMLVHLWHGPPAETPPPATTAAVATAQGPAEVAASQPAAPLPSTPKVGPKSVASAGPGATPSQDSVSDQPPPDPVPLAALPSGEPPPSSGVAQLADRAVEAIQDVGEAAVDVTAKTVDATIGKKARKDIENTKNAQPHTPPFYVAWLVLGVCVWMLLHRPRFRRSVVKFLVRVWAASRWLAYELPVSVIDSQLVHRVLESRAFAVLKGYVLRPVAVTLVLVGTTWVLLRYSLSWLLPPPALTWRNWLDSFLVCNLFLNSPAGRSLEERVLDICVRAWHELRFRIFAVIYHLVMDLFHDAMQWIEQSLYTVDEWLRFRAGDPGRFVLLKILIGSVWSVVSYLIRFVVTLLVEPQVNPIKHFPVVTISHKILIPYTKQILLFIRGSVGAERMSEANAAAITGAIVLLAPGVFGFLVWELKENWQLYVANRAQGIQPVRVGSHGESIAGLLRPGFRSGTLAKLYMKLRSALRLESDPGHGHRSTRQLAHIDAVVLAVRRFVERELCSLIAETKLLDGATISVGKVEPATNRFDIELWCSLAPQRPLKLRWEDLNGWLAARIVDPGWLSDLPVETRTRLNVAMTGLYKLAGVELVREQVLASVTGGAHSEPSLELEADALRLIAPQADPVVYPLRQEGRSISPVTLPGVPVEGWPVVDRGQLIFQATDVGWNEWVNQWPPSGPGSPAPMNLPDLLPIQSQA